MKFFTLLLSVCLISFASFAQNFTAGNLVIYRVGDGSAALSSAATPVFLDEISTNGTAVTTLAMPTSISGSNKIFTATGNSTTEGFLTLTPNKQYIIAPGYDAAVASSSPSAAASATIARVIARIDATKAVNSTTALNTFSAGNIRGAFSTNGTDLWAVGSNIGVVYAALGSTGTGFTLASAPSGGVNLRNVYAFNNQLYISRGAGTGTRVQSVGTGTQTSSGQTTIDLTGLPTAGTCNGFFFADMNSSVAGLDVAYLASDVSGAGLQKYIYNGTTWTASGSISSTLVRGLTAKVVGNDIAIFATTSNNTVVTYTDVNAATSSIATGTFTTIATAGANTAFRGICFAPEIPLTPLLSVSPNSFNITTQIGTASASQSFSLSGTNLTGAPSNIIVTPSAGLEISTDNSTWSSAALNVAYTSATLASTTLYVRIAANAAAGANAGTVTCAGGGSVNAVVNINAGIVQNFYSKPMGNLNDVTTWGTTAADGSGTQPTNFTNAYQIFTVKNRAIANPGTHWEVSGTGSKLIIGDGTNATTVTVSVSDSIKSSTVIDVANNATYNFNHKVAPNFATLATNSTVQYGFNGVTINDTVRVNVANYGNLILQNGLKYFKAGTIVVNGNLTFDNVVNCNGAATPFTTISLKKDLAMLGNSNIEDSTTGFGNRLTLSMAGTATQTITTNGNELSIFRLIRDTTVLNNLDITLTSGSKLTVGNASGGGLSLLQKVSGTPTVTKLILNSGAKLAIVKNGTIYTDVAKAGYLNTTDAYIIVNKSVTSTTYPGTLKFDNFCTLNNLTINITTPTKDSVTIANIDPVTDNLAIKINGNLNLQKGVLIVAPSQILSVLDAATVTGGSVNSYVDGKFNKSFDGPTTFLFPVGRAKQFSPIQLKTNLPTGVGDNFTVEYIKQPYSNLTVSVATLTAIPTYSVSNKEYWDISRGDFSSVPDIKFYYNNPSSGINNATLARIAHFNGTDWDDINRDANGSDANGTYIQKNAILNFSPFTFGGQAGVLPITLVSFNGQVNSNGNLLQWKSSCESIGDKFELQYSNDGRNFVTIFYNNAIGNCNGNEYQYIDTKSFINVNYYRLISINVNGSKNYSNIIVLKNGKQNFEIKLLQSNKNQLCYLINSPTNTNVEVNISNALGQKLNNQNVSVKAGSQLNYVNTSSLSTGIYFITIADANGKIFTEKFVK